MAKKRSKVVTVEEEVSSLLTGMILAYDEEFQKALNDIAKSGVATLKKTSPKSKGKPTFGKKHYADQWAVRAEIERLAFSHIIYNKTPTYRLAHLLEFGHATRGGGRTRGQAHIEPVDRDLMQKALDAAKKAVRKAFS